MAFRSPIDSPWLEPHDSEWNIREQQLERLRYQLEQERQQTSHFKVIAQDMEKNLQDVRETNRRHVEAIETLSRGTGGCVPEFNRQGDFTVCVLVDPIAERLFMGVAKCSPTDKFDDLIGQAISYGRAANARAEYYAEKAYAK